MAASIATQVSEKVFEVDNGDWPIRNVTVYDNQAEVTRSLNFKPTEAGINVLKLRGLPLGLTASSLRADVISKNARMLEVSVETKYETGERDVKLDVEMKELQRQIEKLQMKVGRISLKKQKIEAHKVVVMATLNANAVENDQSTLKPVIFDKLGSSIDFYTKLLTTAEEEMEQLQNEINELVQKKSRAQAKQNTLVAGKNVQIASVLLDVPELYIKKSEKTVDVDLLYLINGASWHAKYDIRVEKDAEDKAVLSYFAEVTNSTGENWVEVNMGLSTAKPSVGGALPKLPRRQVDFREAMEAIQYQQDYNNNNLNPLPTKWTHNRASLAMSPMHMMNVVNFDMQQEQRAMPPIPQLVPQMAMDFAAAAPQAPPPPFPSAAPLPKMAKVAAGDAGSTLFKIQRLANIDSDNKPHKQTIGIIELSAVYTHAVSPKVSKNVFIKCQTKNPSEYPFLPGNLRVFIDGSFVSNSEMRLVRPSEPFALFLGIDDSVKLTYSPEKVLKKTVGGGFGGKKRWYKSTCREIIVTNSSGKDINCCIYEQLPLSKDGKVKVELKKPDMSKKTEGRKYNINSFNNLETRTKIPDSKKFKMEFEFVLEWPEGEELKFQFKKADK